MGTSDCVKTNNLHVISNKNNCFNQESFDKWLLKKLTPDFKTIADL